MRRSSVVILVAASGVALGAGWIAGLPLDSPPVEPTPQTPGAVPTVTPTPSVPLTVDGAVVDTKYGTVQVQVVILDRLIIDVVALKLTDSSATSVDLSARAAPILREEVLAAQSAKVDMVSSATYTSQAYLTSLQAALDAAGFTG
ncbi:hypothetical protein BH11ACT4_BH11ACT4_11120 [soil metagenome]